MDYSGRSGCNGTNRIYKGKPVAKPFKRKSGLEPVPRIECPHCRGSMSLCVARQHSVRDWDSPNHGKRARGLRLWRCHDCEGFADAWDGWEIPDDLRWRYYTPFRNTLFGKAIVLAAVCVLIAAFTG